MKTILRTFVSFALLGIALAPAAFADAPTATALTTPTSSIPVQSLMAEQSSGGWGLNCQTIQLTCTSSGRVLGCQATVGDVGNRSECQAHWGDRGWVSCRVYDPNGTVLASFSDECP